MSTAPKTGKLPNAIVYGLIAVVVVIVLLCGGVFFWFVATNLFGSGGSANKGGKPVSTTDALKSVDAFVSDLRNEEYAHALKYRASAGLRRKYNADSLKELVEKDGKALLGATNWHYLQTGQTPEAPKFVGQIGGGPSGAIRIELTVIDEGDGPRISEVAFLKD